MIPNWSLGFFFVPTLQFSSPCNWERAFENSQIKSLLCSKFFKTSQHRLSEVHSPHFGLQPYIICFLATTLSLPLFYWLIQSRPYSLSHSFFPYTVICSNVFPHRHLTNQYSLLLSACFIFLLLEIIGL